MGYRRRVFGYMVVWICSGLATSLANKLILQRMPLSLSLSTMQFVATGLWQYAFNVLQCTLAPAAVPKRASSTSRSVLDTLGEAQPGYVGKH